MKLTAILVTACLWRATVNAHMSLSYPVPYRSPQNPNTPSGKADYSMTSPLNADGSNFPCKGYQVDFGTPAGKSVATWAAGGTYNFSVVGGATHNGGSCQASLSYDGGKSFTVIHSFVGGCPLSPSFDFQVPSDAKTGDMMFAWTWYNNVGNRELYMNCATVTITGAAGNKSGGTPFSSRPSIFVANMDNGCTTIETTDVVFPDPGPDLTDISKAPGQVKGTCKAVDGIGGESSSGSSSGGSSMSGASPTLSTISANAAIYPSSISANAAVYPSTTSANSAITRSTTSANAAISPSDGESISNNAMSTLAASPFTSLTSSSYLTPSAALSGFVAVTMSGALVPSAAPSFSTGADTAGSAGTSTAVSSASPTGALKQSTDGSCGNGFTCSGLALGNCCSQYGWCGNSDLHCGSGCQAAYGDCDSAGGSSNANTSDSSGSTGSSSEAPSSFAALPSTSSEGSISYMPSSSGNKASSSSALSNPTTFVTSTSTGIRAPSSSNYMASTNCAFSNLTMSVASTSTSRTTTSSTFIPLVISDLSPSPTDPPKR